MIQQVFRAAVRVVQVRRDLKRSVEEEAAKRVIDSKSKAFSKALDDLDVAVDRAARASASQAKAMASPGFDWNGFFKATIAGFEFIKEVKNAPTPEAAKKAAQTFVDAEVVGVKDRRAP